MVVHPAGSVPPFLVGKATQTKQSRRTTALARPPQPQNPLSALNPTLGGPSILATCFLCNPLTLPCSLGLGTPWIALGSLISAGSSRTGTLVTTLR